MGKRSNNKLTARLVNALMVVCPYCKKRHYHEVHGDSELNRETFRSLCADETLRGTYEIGNARVLNDNSRQPVKSRNPEEGLVVVINKGLPGFKGFLDAEWVKGVDGGIIIGRHGTIRTYKAKTAHVYMPNGSVSAI